MAQEFGTKTRIYSTTDISSAEALARSIEAFLADQEDMACQSFETDSGFVIQARKADEWKKYVMLDNAVQINIVSLGEYAHVEIGSGKWASKAAAGVIGLMSTGLLGIALVGFSAFGALDLYSLPDRVFRHIESIYGIKDEAAPQRKSEAAKCPNCGLSISTYSKFCSNCGQKL
ncbi:MAG: zinc ribbon domain-containing protein [Eubacteriaceae bacterium]|jgi:ribosomal protein S27AE|nr:zinc ribbon domain-containing protein [Eubacteriaceae bacterium]